MAHEKPEFIHVAFFQTLKALNTTETGSVHFHFLLFNCCVTVVLLLEKGAYYKKIKNQYVLYCHIKLTFLLTVYVFGSCKL